MWLRLDNATLNVDRAQAISLAESQVVIQMTNGKPEVIRCESADAAAKLYEAILDILGRSTQIVGRQESPQKAEQKGE